jgi:hypothetical protein
VAGDAFSVIFRAGGGSLCCLSSLARLLSRSGGNATLTLERARPAPGERTGDVMWAQSRPGPRCSSANAEAAVLRWVSTLPDSGDRGLPLESGRVLSALNRTGPYEGLVVFWGKTTSSLSSCPPSAAAHGQGFVLITLPEGASTYQRPPFRFSACPLACPRAVSAT